MRVKVGMEVAGVDQGPSLPGWNQLAISLPIPKKDVVRIFDLNGIFELNKILRCFSSDIKMPSENETTDHERRLRIEASPVKSFYKTVPLDETGKSLCWQCSIDVNIEKSDSRILELCYFKDNFLVRSICSQKIHSLWPNKTAFVIEWKKPLSINSWVVLSLSVFATVIIL